MGRQWGLLVVAIIAIIASRVTASSSGEVRVRRLAQGHLDTPLAGAGDRTSEPSGYQQTRSTSSATDPPTTSLRTCLAVSESVPSSAGSACGALAAGLCTLLFLSCRLGGTALARTCFEPSLPDPSFSLEVHAMFTGSSLW